MTMQGFAYSLPDSLAAAAAQGGAVDAKLLAGGQSLLGAMKLGLAAPEALVDLGAIAELKGITVAAGVVKIGAMTSHAAVAASAEVARAIPALADLAGHIGDRQVRHRGTLGGSLANNDPAACYPAALLALGATVHTDRRVIAADDFLQGIYQTALADDELITAVSFPLPERAGYVKFKQPASRFALVGVFVAKGPQGVRVAVTGAGSGAVRLPALEARLAKDWSAAACSGVTVAADSLHSDLHATAEYRAALIPVLAARAVAAS
jgi:aerobic carbon-monoxide dehydrogenase medium subunit